MSEYKFGDVVEWDIFDGRTIRWFIISGHPGDYQAVHISTIGKTGRRWEYEDGRVCTIGVGSTASHATAPPRLLNE